MDTTEPQSPWAFPGLLVLSVLARLPYGMGAVGVLTVGAARHLGAERIGLLATCFTLGLAAAAPQWGALADRRGLPLVLRSCLVANLLGTSLLTFGHHGAAVIGSVLLGIGTPPVAAAMRVTWNRLLPEGPPRDRATTFESILAEGVHIVGRVLVAALASFAAGAILLVQAALLLVGGLGLSFDRRVAPSLAAPAGSSRFSSVRVAWPLLLVTLLACSAHGCIATVFTLVPTELAVGPALMTVWGLGSLTGGLAFLRWRGGRVTPLLVPAGLLWVAAGCLVGIAGFRLGLSGQVVTALALGLPLAPTFSGLYAAAGALAPAGRENATFAMMSSVVVVAFGVGTAVTGVLGGAAVPLVAGFSAAAAFSLAALAANQLLLRPRVAPRRGRAEGAAAQPG